MSERIVIGIDPGVSGAFGLLADNSEFFNVYDMPPNPADIYDMLRVVTTCNCSFSAILEQQNPRPGNGAAATFKMGVGFGVIQATLAALKIPYTIVSPAKWKRAMGLDTDKEKSRAMARAMWPDAPLNLKKHEGRAEALLLAEWRRRQP